MGCGSADDFAQIIAGSDRSRIRAAHPAGGFRRNAAGPHIANPAAQTFCAEFASIDLRLDPIETGIHTLFARFFQGF
jgi:hypothetical protein